MIKVICTDISRLTDSDYLALYEQASAERKARADRYRRHEDSLRCVAADALLRFALGTASYTIETAPGGKPFVKGREAFCFNLTHSGNWVAIAFGDSEVGIDIETLRVDTDIDAIAGRYFAPDEQRYIFETEEQRQWRFYRIWTGKESYLKYLGTGLKKNLTSFSVLSLDPNLRLHHRNLPDGSHQTLCTTENDYLFELLDLQRL